MKIQIQQIRTIMLKPVYISVFLTALLLFASLPAAFADNIPANGTVTMIDLGAKACVPCKMMAPIMEKMEKKYAGKAVIHFYDVWKDREPAIRFKIRVIPTQIFFDKDAKEVYRHEGFMSESDIVAQLTKMGVK
jgi:thioredoxin 1